MKRAEQKEQNERPRLKKAKLEVNVVIGFIETRSLSVTETNVLSFAAANVLQFRKVIDRNREKGKKIESLWKKRIRLKIKQLRLDAGKLKKDYFHQNYEGWN